MGKALKRQVPKELDYMRDLARAPMRQLPPLNVSSFVWSLWMLSRGRLGLSFVSARGEAKNLADALNGLSWSCLPAGTKVWRAVGKSKVVTHRSSVIVEGLARLQADPELRARVGAWARVRGELDRVKAAERVMAYMTPAPPPGLAALDPEQPGFW